MQPSDNSADVLELYVTLGVPGDGALVLRMSQELRDAVLTLLDEHGLQHGSRVEASAGASLAVEAVTVLSAAGGVAALASVINTVIKRNDSKRVVMEQDGHKFEASGYSEAAIKRLVAEQAGKQQAREAEWDRLKDTPRPSDPGGDAE